MHHLTRGFGPTQREINNGPHAGLGNVPSDYRDDVKDAERYRILRMWIARRGHLPSAVVRCCGDARCTMAEVDAAVDSYQEKV